MKNAIYWPDYEFYRKQQEGVLPELKFLESERQRIAAELTRLEALRESLNKREISALGDLYHCFPFDYKDKEEAKTEFSKVGVNSKATQKIVAFVRNILFSNSPAFEHFNFLRLDTASGYNADKITMFFARDNDILEIRMPHRGGPMYIEMSSYYHDRDKSMTKLADGKIEIIWRGVECRNNNCHWLGASFDLEEVRETLMKFAVGGRKAFGLVDSTIDEHKATPYEIEHWSST